MFQTRPSGMEAGSRRFRRELLQISAPNEYIPLQEDWPNRWITLTKGFEYAMEDIFNLEVRPDDVFVVTYMKCGTTWMQEAAWLLLNDLDFERAKRISISERSPFLDWIGVSKDFPNSIEVVNAQASPRLIKTHLPANLLPKQVWQKKAKIICVARNVKDVVISTYHFLSGLGNWTGSLDEFVYDFMQGYLNYLPYLERVMDFWHMRHLSNVCFITYEQMKRDLPGVLQRLCKFLDKPELSGEELQQMTDHLCFEEMSDNKQTNLTKEFTNMRPEGVSRKFQFMRRGIIGSYKDELTPEQKRKLDDWSSAFFAKYGLTEQDIFGAV